MKLDKDKLVHEIDIWEHLEFMYQYCIELNAQTILELGVRNGGSTSMFVQACKATGGRLISVDIVDCSHVCDWPGWIFILGDDLYVKIQAVVDVLFIDTTHEHKHTLAELEKYAPLVRPGGVIMLHDTARASVYQAINDFRGNNINYSFTERDTCNGLGILTKLRGDV